jgi:hypothetical protein
MVSKNEFGNGHGVLQVAGRCFRGRTETKAEQRTKDSHCFVNDSNLVPPER